MKLEIVERIHLLNLLPAEGNAVTLRVVNELKQELSFSEKEIKDGKIEADPETGQIRWSPEASVVKDVKIGDTAEGIINKALKKLDEDEKLTEQLMPIYDRFVK